MIGKSSSREWLSCVVGGKCGLLETPPPEYRRRPPGQRGHRRNRTGCMPICGKTCYPPLLAPELGTSSLRCRSPKILSARQTNHRCTHALMIVPNPSPASRSARPFLAPRTFYFRAHPESRIFSKRCTDFPLVKLPDLQNRGFRSRSGGQKRKGVPPVFSNARRDVGLVPEDILNGTPKFLGGRLLKDVP